MIREIHSGLRRFKGWARRVGERLVLSICTYPILRTYNGARVEASPYYWRYIERLGTVDRTNRKTNRWTTFQRDRWGLTLRGIYLGLTRPKPDPKFATYTPKGPGPGFSPDSPPPLVSRLISTKTGEQPNLVFETKQAFAKKQENGRYRFPTPQTEVPDTHILDVLL